MTPAMASFPGFTTSLTYTQCLRKAELLLPCCCLAKTLQKKGFNILHWAPLTSDITTQPGLPGLLSPYLRDQTQGA